MDKQHTPLTLRRTIDPTSDGTDSVDGVCADISATLRVRLDDVVDSICRSIPTASEVSVSEVSGYQAGRKAAVRAAVEYALDAIENQYEELASIPEPLADHVRRAASVGVRQGVVVRRYFSGHKQFTRLLAEALDYSGHPSTPAFLEQLSARFRPLWQHIVAELERVHDREHRRIERSPQQRRAMLVRSLLVEDLDVDELDRIGYDIHRWWHACMIAADPDGAESFRRLKRQLGPNLLIVPGDGSMVWAWLGASKRLPGRELERLLARTGQMHPAALAAGEFSQGLVGWRETHHEATLALPLAKHRRRWTRCIDHLPVVTAACDMAIVRMYYDRYILPLLRLEKRGRVLQETLRVYFDHGHSSTLSAQAIGVSRHTIANRVNDAMRLLDDPPTMTGLEVALTLEAMGCMKGLSDVH